MAKSLYSPEMMQKAVNYLSQSVTVKDCCALLGITSETFFKWCKRHPEFADTTTRARAQGRLGALLVIQDSVVNNKDTDSAKWLLERTDPENWGRKDKLILDVEPRLLRELKAKADAADVNLSQLFEDLINEFADATHHTNDSA